MGYPHVKRPYRSVLSLPARLPRYRTLLGQAVATPVGSVGLPFADVLPFVHDLVRRAPNRLLWGSDWPHPSYFNPMPNDADLVDLLAEWAPDKRPAGYDHGGEPEGPVRVRAGGVGTFRIGQGERGQASADARSATRETRRRITCPMSKSRISPTRVPAPDLDRAEEFLLDFGLVRADAHRRRSTCVVQIRRHSRGDPSRRAAAARLGLVRGEPRRSEIVVEVSRRFWHRDRRRARRWSARSLEDPLGYDVEFIHGRRGLAPIPVTPTALNLGWNGLARKEIQQFPKRPSQVKRIAHVVLTTTDVKGP